MDKYKVGIPVNGYRKIYSEDIDKDMGINPKRLDYVDIQNLSNETIAQINDLNKKRIELIEKVANERREKQREDLKQELKKELENDKP